MTSETVQRYARVLVYTLCGALIQYGVTISTSNKEMIAGIVALLANLAWTIWGNRLTALLAEASKSTEVDSGKLAAAVSDPAMKDAIKTAAVT